MRLLSVAAHYSMAFRRAIMPGAKQLIQRYRPVTAIIALKKSVMEKMEIALANRISGAIFALPFMVTHMTQGRRQTRRLYMEDSMYGM